jgi:hypothetical protein
MSRVTINEIRAAFPDGQMKGKEWFALCPHCKHHALSIKPGDRAPVVAYCMRCDKDMTAELSEKFDGSEPAAPKKPKPSEANDWGGITLEQYCAPRHLLPGTITQFFDGKEVMRRGKPVLAFPYFNEDGSLRLTKMRLSSSSHDTYTEPAGVDMLPFGLRNPIVCYSKHDDLFIAEGESDCFTLAQFGYPTIAISGSKGWKPEFAMFNAVEQAKQVFIAEQQDDDGRKLTEGILQDVPDALVLRPLHGVKDFNELWVKCYDQGGGDDIGQFLFIQDIKTSIQTARLERALRKPKKDAARPAGMRDEAFHGLAGKIVRLLEPYLEVDRAAILANVLACVGVLFERNGYFKVAADFHYPIDYFLIVGDTAKARKGTTTNSVLELAERVSPKFKSRVLYSLSTGEGLINAVIKESEEKKEIADPKYPAAFVNLGELAGLLAVMARDNNTLSSVLRDAWDGKPLQVNTRHLRLCVENVSLGIIANVTRSDLVKINPVDIGNGFINRFMFIWSERGRLLPEGANIDALFKSEAFALVLKELHEAIAASAERGEVVRSPESEELWKSMYYDFNRGGDTVVDKLIARNDAHTMRLSLLYALLDRSPVIKPCHLEAARAVWDYSEQSLKYIFSAPDLESQKILEALEDGPLTLGEIRRRVFKDNRPPEYVTEKLAGLEKDRKVRRVEKEVKSGKKQAWALNS